MLHTQKIPAFRPTKKKEVPMNRIVFVVVLNLAMLALGLVAGAVPYDGGGFTCPC